MAAATGLSRRTADELIAKGEVQVNGQIGVAGQTVDPSDKVVFKGQILVPQDLQTVLLNKPVGYVSSRRQQGQAPTIYELLPAELHHLKPVGRLDKDSCGLMALTNDGELAQRLQHPSGGKLKEYFVQTDKKVAPEDLAKFNAGIELEDGPTRIAVDPVDKGYKIAMQEGRNRQIRRTFAALGYRVTYLQRRRLGGWSLDQAGPEGSWRNAPPIG